MSELTSLATHFEFGENWLDFLRHVDEPAILRAEEGLKKSLQGRSLEGKTFLDIGCGSGLHTLCALRLGASRVLAIDIDPASVAATKALLLKYAPSAPVDVRELSVFDAKAADIGTFDVVYSWGVLHHTGSMWRAIDHAATLVAPEGALSIALYRWTYSCWAWRLEKRWYVDAPEWQRSIMRRAYKAGFFLANLAIARNPFKIRERAAGRGMNYDTDVHDWMGGYPYESASYTDVCDHIPNGFTLAGASFRKRNAIGLFGTGCDEYLFDRVQPYPFPVLEGRLLQGGEILV